jgi:hypothetical protein
MRRMFIPAPAQSNCPRRRLARSNARLRLFEAGSAPHPVLRLEKANNRELRAIVARLNAAPTSAQVATGDDFAA